MSLPVARISIHCDVALARVGEQEHNRNVLLYGCCGGADEVEVVEEPRKSSMIDASPRLERLVWLYYPIQRQLSPSFVRIERRTEIL
jgi:hypothetical protein